MKLYELIPAKGSKHSKKRVGRGYGSGHGGTSTRGDNGQNSRSGGGVRLGFEGGQMPLVRRLPKRGFNNSRFNEKVGILNISDIEKYFKDKKEINLEDIYAEGLVKKGCKVKILGKGTLSSSKIISANYFSKKAEELIKKSQGEIKIIK